MVLKSQDLVIALKVFTFHQSKWNQRDLAQCLGMSLSEVNGGLKRCIKSGLMMGTGSRNIAPEAVPYSLQEFICFGVRYAFFGEKGTVARGVSTGLEGAKLAGAVLKGESTEGYVWPFPHGKARGVSIQPLFKSIPRVIEKTDNKELYILLSLVDLIRIGRARERKLATETLYKFFKSGIVHV